MIIGKRPDRGELSKENKWYIGIEILKCPPSMFRCFRPYVFVWFFKIIDHGEPYKVNGKPTIKKGGWKHFTFPITIKISIYKN